MKNSDANITDIPGYQITGQIYESASSLVFRGLRDEDSLPVVLKVLKEDYPSPEDLTRYRQEYDITRALADSEGVVKAHSLEKYGNTLVMCLEDFGGESLRHWLAERRMSLTERLTLAVRAAEILGQIHRQNIIHKDINPANLVLNPATGVLKIIDFGISTRLSRQHPTLKNPDVLEGTLAYISPEQTGRMNRALDYRTDIYSLGVTFYELFTGKTPFESEDAAELVHSHIAVRPAPPVRSVPDCRPSFPTSFSDCWKRRLRHATRAPGASAPIWGNVWPPCEKPARSNPLPWPGKTYQTVFRFRKNSTGVSMRRTSCFPRLNGWRTETGRRSCWSPAIRASASPCLSERYTAPEDRAVSFPASLTNCGATSPTVRLSVLSKN